MLLFVNLKELAILVLATYQWGWVGMFTAFAALGLLNLAEFWATRKLRKMMEDDHVR